MRPALLALVVALAACAGPGSPRLRFVSSLPGAAAWSFTVDDHGRDATLLVDERPRPSVCRRAGREQICYVRGLFTGGHQIELRLPGAVLRRTAVIGRPWPRKPFLVRVRTVEEARQAVDAGADGVLAATDKATVPLADLADAAHKKGARFVVEGPGAAEAVERAGADGVYDQPLDPDVAARFSETRAFASDPQASALVQKLADGAPIAEARALGGARGLVEVRGPLGAALALLAPAGAVVETSAQPVLAPRARHPALRDGQVELVDVEGAHLRAELVSGKDRVTLLINAGDAPWVTEGLAGGRPLDLLGGNAEGARLTVRPRDAALVIETPGLKNEGTQRY